MVSFAGLIGIFVLAYACERLVKYMMLEIPLYLKGESAYAAYQWVESVVVIVLACGLLLLSWYVVAWTDRDRWVASAFLVIGLGVTFVSAIYTSIQSSLIPWGLTEFMVRGSYVRNVAAFVAVAGIASLVVPRRSSR
jgi:hypothetical protein